MRVGEDLRQVGDLRVVLQDAGDLVGDDLQLLHQRGAALVGDGAELLGQAQREQEERGHLGGERLRGSDADLRTDMRVATGVRGTGDGRTDHVADAEEEGARLAGQVDGGEGIGRLAGLGDGDHHVRREDDRTAVAEFRGVFHLDRLARQLLQ